MSCEISAEEMAAGASDCYGKYWGAAIGLNLNQPIDMTTGEGADPEPYDATAHAITGFGFTVDGANVPTNLRFKVEDASGEYCTGSETVLAGGSSHTVKFDQVFKECWQPAAMRGVTPDATAQKGLIKIAWQVPTKKGGSIPFDFCISNVVATQ
jgi:hypothetical protein